VSWRILPALYGFGEHRQNVLRFIPKRRSGARGFPVLATFFQRKEPAPGFNVKAVVAMP
jgi:hypothetical protein